MALNQELIQKADFQTASLTSDGGALPPDKFDQFVLRAVEETEFLGLANTGSQAAPTAQIPKMKFVGRVAHYVPTPGTALAEAQRSAPVTSEVTITAHKFVAECTLERETLEDNVERESLEAHLMGYFPGLIGRDTQDNVINGATTSTDVDLTPFNGLRAAVTTYQVDALSAALSIDMIEEAMTSLPGEFRQRMDSKRLIMSDILEMKWRKAMAARATTLGDVNTVERRAQAALGVQFLPITKWPVDLGITGNLTDAILTDPANIRVSYWRRVEQVRVLLEREDKVTYIWRYRMGSAMEEEEAAARIYNILCA
jgi:hypothetical protein